MVRPQAPEQVQRAGARRPTIETDSGLQIQAVELGRGVRRRAGQCQDRKRGSSGGAPVNHRRCFRRRRGARTAHSAGRRSRRGAPERAAMLRVGIIEEHTPAVGNIEACNNAQQRRLAGPRRPEQYQQLASREIEAYTAEHAGLAEAPPNVLDPDRDLAALRRGAWRQAHLRGATPGATCKRG